MIKTMFAWGAATIIVVVSARGQGTFQNLDFEAAHNLPASGGSVAVTNALPGWSAFFGGSQLSSITYDSVTAVPRVGLYGPNSFEISGSFSVLLSNGGSISQTGLVATNVESLRFKASQPRSSPLGVSLGGQGLAYTAISSGPNYTLYGAGISPFAGQTASLAFMVPSGSLYFIDDIEFSPQIIPEPASLTLFGLGVSFLAAHRLHRRCSKR